MTDPSSITTPFGSPMIIGDAAWMTGGRAATLAIVEQTVAVRGFRDATTLVTSDVAAAVRDAVAAGKRFLAIVGDDRSFHEAVNGLFDDDGEPLAADAVLAVIPAAGTSDVVKTFGLPEDSAKACGHLTGGRFYEMDVARLACAGPNGGESVRYFANVAEVGFGAKAVAIERALPSFLGRGRRFLGFWLGLARSPSRDVTVQADRKIYEGPAYNIVVGNGQFFGGGLRISPRSYPGDGILDVLVAKGPRSDAYRSLPLMYRGEHIPSERVAELRGKSVRIESPRSLPVHVDGQPAGFTPVAIEVIPKAFRLKV